MTAHHSGPSDSGHDKLVAAEKVWRQCKPISGTLVEEYLHGCGIAIVAPSTLRCNPRLRHTPSNTDCPGMVARLSDGVSGAGMGIFRKYLTEDGRAKASVQPNEMFLGPCRGGVVWLSEVDTDRTVLIGQRIETCLAAMQATKLAALATLTPAGFFNLKLHPDIGDIIIVPEKDWDRNAKGKVHSAARRWIREGRRVRIARLPNAGVDFCDLLTGRARME